MKVIARNCQLKEKVAVLQQMAKAGTVVCIEYESKEHGMENRVWGHVAEVRKAEFIDAGLCVDFKVEKMLCVFGSTEGSSEIGAAHGWIINKKMTVYLFETEREFEKFKIAVQI